MGHAVDLYPIIAHPDANGKNVYSLNIISLV